MRRRCTGLEQELVKLKLIHKTTSDDLEAAEKQVASLKKALQEVARPLKPKHAQNLKPGDSKRRLMTGKETFSIPNLEPFFQAPRLTHVKGRNEMNRNEGSRSHIKPECKVFAMNR